jgi:hypothetical protein
MWSESSESRKNWDYKWFVYGMWVRGYHYARYDKRQKMIVGTPPNDGRPQVSINRIYPTLRAVRNYALRNQPKAQVIPDVMTENALDVAKNTTKFLDYIHETQKLRPKLKASVFQALETSTAWWQIVWAGEDISVNPVDVFDYYPDPKARTQQEARYGVMAVVRVVSDLLEDDKYIKSEVQEIKPDNKRSSSTYKEMLLNYDSNQQTNPTDGTVVVKEFWYKEDGKIYVAATAGGRLIRKPEEVDTPIIPFFKLAADIMPFSLYGEGWVKNMIDPQKLLNSAVSSVAEYNVLMNKAKVVVDKGAGVRIYNNQHGQIIEKKRGYNLETQTVAPLNTAIFEQIQFAQKFIEDTGAVHDATMGRVPTGARSGKAIEGLQQGDSNNMSELVENIEDFLQDVYEYILWLVSQKYQETKNVLVADYTNHHQLLKVVGSSSPVAEAMGDQPPDDTLVIGEKNLVDVKISSYLSYTPEAKRESVKELASLIPDLPPDVILDAYGVGNIADVVAKVKEKQKEDMARQSEQQTGLMEKQQDIENPKANGQEAIAAIRTMMEGGTPQAPARPGPDYIQILDQWLQREGEMGEVDPQVVQAVQTFRDQVVQGAGR